MAQFGQNDLLHRQADGGGGDDRFDGSGSLLTPLILKGGSGSDTLLSANGADSLVGDNGNDVLTGGGADDTLDGGDGDVAVLSLCRSDGVFAHLEVRREAYLADQTSGANPDLRLVVAEAVATMGLAHVVITSVDGDDLENGGAEGFAGCITEIKRRSSPTTAVSKIAP